MFPHLLCKLLFVFFGQVYESSCIPLEHHFKCACPNVAAFSYYQLNDSFLDCVSIIVVVTVKKGNDVSVTLDIS
ncbi:hypothetical protein D3C76_1649160 [compost metagenome]